MSAWDSPDGVSEAGEGDGDTPPASSSRALVLTSVLVVVCVVGILVVVLATRAPAANRIADSPLVGRQAPAIAGTTLDGGSYDLADDSGRWVLVNFFATWCAPCRQEHDDLVRFYEDHQVLGDASVVSIVFSDEISDARRFFEENGAPFPVIVSDDGDIALDYGVAKVPESYLVSPSGMIVAKILGGVTAPGLEEILARFS